MAAVTSFVARGDSRLRIWECLLPHNCGDCKSESVPALKLLLSRKRNEKKDVWRGNRSRYGCSDFGYIPINFKRKRTAKLGSGMYCNEAVTPAPH
jgi:hypothetical protein